MIRQSLNIMVIVFEKLELTCHCERSEAISSTVAWRLLRRPPEADSSQRHEKASTQDGQEENEAK